MAIDADDARALQVFLEVHRDLPREGPGNRAAAERALLLVGRLPAGAEILDVACGPGGQTLDLARLLPEARITAFDRRHTYLSTLAARAAAAGLDGRIAIVQADMRDPPFTTGRFDLVWCEGAAYIIGVEHALTRWRALLRQGGAVAFSEAVWLRDDVPDELTAWWRDGYPAMGDVEDCRRKIRQSGFELVGDFVMPDSAWWEHYYEPLAARLDRLAPTYADDHIATGVIAECRREIEFFRRYSDIYGYVFFVARMASAD